MHRSRTSCRGLGHMCYTAWPYSGSYRASVAQIPLSYTAQTLYNLQIRRCQRLARRSILESGPPGRPVRRI